MILSTVNILDCVDTEKKTSNKGNKNTFISKLTK